MESSELTDEDAPGTAMDFVLLQAQFAWNKASQRLRRLLLKNHENYVVCIDVAILLLTGTLV